MDLRILSNEGVDAMSRDAQSSREPRYSLEAESSVLGGLLLNNAVADDVFDIVNSADFYHQSNKHIFTAMEQLHRDNKPLDELTITEALQQLSVLDEVGGTHYLADIVVNTPSSANILSYAQIVREYAVLRQLIGASHEIITAAHNPKGLAVKDLLDKAQEKILKIADSHSSGEGPKEIGGIMRQTINLLNERSNFYKDNPNAIIGTTSGFKRLDKVTSGFQPGNMIILAARPSMGKTSLAMNFVEHAIMKTDQPVVFFSLEMPQEEVTMRLLSSLSNINLSNLARGDIADDGWNRLQWAVKQLGSKPLYIDDQGALSPYEIRSRVRRVAKNHNGELGLIVIDYLQLMSIGGFGNDRHLEVAEISRMIKSLAKEMRVPIIALSQLNRSLEQRANRRPVMSDLRESGAIEQDADLIMFIYRDRVYNPETPDPDAAEIIIGKHRNGPTGTINLHFNGACTRFEEREDRYDDYDH
ncbi:MAG: replicative DNA helicase [Pseudomonadota bacterium]|nr:replicative DNA helicase [Pseudomonadota bacterium]